VPYTTWKVGDTIQLCAKVEDFCGEEYQFLYLYDADIQKEENCILDCARPNCAYGCINTSNREVIVKSVRDYNITLNDVNCSNLSADKIYRTLGSMSTDTRGIAGIYYTVTEQDRSDYLDAIENNKTYDIVFCMTDDLATSAHAIVFQGVVIEENPCKGIICPDICIDNDLWSQKCDPDTQKCVKDVLKKENAPECTATHYIEYDFTGLPQDFRDFVFDNITYIANALGGYLPLPENIQYVSSDYANGKFRIYVIYTPPLSGITLENFAVFVASILIFIIAGRISAGFLTITIILSVIGVVLLSWTIYDIAKSESTSGTQSEPSALDKIKIIEDYINNYHTKSCNELYPDCATEPPTCDAGTMRAYLGCIGGMKLAQYDHATSISGQYDQNKHDEIANKIKDTDQCLANGTCTPNDAKNALNKITSDVNTAVENAENKVTCGTDEFFNEETKQCEPVCWIHKPLVGGCLLTAKTGKLILLGVALAGMTYIAYKLSQRK